MNMSVWVNDNVIWNLKALVMNALGEEEKGNMKVRGERNETYLEGFE
jgi:hypothetical protein